MTWVGSFKSLQAVLPEPSLGAPLRVHTWLESEIALREAVSNAILHGNRSEARKLVHVRCCCEATNGVFIVVRDQGSGFDPNAALNPLAVENLLAEHGRGIYLMKFAVDEVSFDG